jgi:FlaA1/EpsC-like NDP-sugar epimerase
MLRSLVRDSSEGLLGIRKMTPARRGTLMRWVFADTTLITATPFLAYAIAARDFHLSIWGEGTFWLALGLVTSTILMLTLRGLYSIQARYLSLWEGVNLFGVCFCSTLVFLLFDRAFRSVPVRDELLSPILYLFILTVFLTSLRVAYRAVATWSRASDPDAAPAPRTIIVGAGDGGEMVIREIKKMRRPTHHIVAIVDEDDSKYGTRLHGVPVIGRPEHLPVLAQRHQITEVLIAMTSADGEKMRQIARTCIQAGVRTRTLPAVQEMIAGRLVISQVRDIDLVDLLRRPPVVSDAKAAAYLNGEVILITGGGGSIGAELARQVGRLRPANLILVGKGENSIFEIEQQLIREIGLEPVAVIADVRDRQSMEAVFEKHRPTIVFHAAAHKHVPLMQGNPIEAIRNNVFGTMEVADLSHRFGAKKFILISTDKAVNPGNVMGATKRVAEMIIRAKAQRSETDFAVVRFGNVLGSRGSLLPNLKAQIQSGGPVRVTHREMTRFFMTIPEAVQLIVQAGAFGKRGEIFILDMGEAVSVLDLAQDVIRLHGLEPNVTMPIVFTGPRPGEKLHEELTYEFESLMETAHPKIRVVDSEPEFDWDDLQIGLRRLAKFCDSRNAELAKKSLMTLAFGNLDIDLDAVEIQPATPIPLEAVVQDPTGV